MQQSLGIILLVKRQVSCFYRPIEKAEDWKYLLAEPDRQWKTGFSAKTLAYCWQESNEFHAEIERVFHESGISDFKEIELLVAFPEYKVPLPGGIQPSQNDVFVLAKGKRQLISIAVEGKVSEPFGEMIVDWKERDDGGKDDGGKQVRLHSLCDVLELDISKLDNIRYQLLHRTASAVIEAQRFNAINAVMLVHSFSPTNEWFEDYQSFLTLFGKKGKLNALVCAGKINRVKLYLGWVEGNRDYLKK